MSKKIVVRNTVNLFTLTFEVQKTLNTHRADKQKSPQKYGNSELGAHVRSNLSYLICLTHLIRSRAAINWILSPNRHIFLNACATFSGLPHNISALVMVRGEHCVRQIYFRT